jgi:hypothetical protein
MQQPYRSVWTELLETPFRQAWVDAGGLKTRYTSRPAIRPSPRW